MSWWWKLLALLVTTGMVLTWMMQMHLHMVEDRKVKTEDTRRQFEVLRKEIADRTKEEEVEIAELRKALVAAERAGRVADQRALEASSNVTKANSELDETKEAMEGMKKMMEELVATNSQTHRIDERLTAAEQQVASGVEKLRDEMQKSSRHATVFLEQRIVGLEERLRTVERNITKGVVAASKVAVVDEKPAKAPAVADMATRGGGAAGVAAKLPSIVKPPTVVQAADEDEEDDEEEETSDNEGKKPTADLKLLGEKDARKSYSTGGSSNSVAEPAWDSRDLMPKRPLPLAQPAKPAPAFVPKAKPSDCPPDFPYPFTPRGADFVSHCCSSRFNCHGTVLDPEEPDCCGGKQRGKPIAYRYLGPNLSNVNCTTYSWWPLAGAGNNSVPTWKRMKTSAEIVSKADREASFRAGFNSTKEITWSGKELRWWDGIDATYAKTYVGSSWITSGQRQFEAAVKFMNLDPQHQLLEIGCGALNAGQFFIKHLHMGRYTCVEPNEQLYNATAEANSTIKSTMRLKAAKFIPRDDFDPRTVSTRGQVYDRVWSHSVLSHAADWQLMQYFEVLSAVLAEDGEGLASMRFSDGAGKKERASHDTSWIYPSVSYFDFEEVVCMAHRVGLDVSLRPDIRLFMTEVVPAEFHDWIHIRRLRTTTSPPPSYVAALPGQETQSHLGVKVVGAKSGGMRNQTSPGAGVMRNFSSNLGKESEEDIVIVDPEKEKAEEPQEEDSPKQNNLGNDEAPADVWKADGEAAEEDSEESAKNLPLQPPGGDAKNPDQEEEEQEGEETNDAASDREGGRAAAAAPPPAAVEDEEEEQEEDETQISESAKKPGLRGAGVAAA